MVILLNQEHTNFIKCFVIFDIFAFTLIRVFNIIEEGKVGGPQIRLCNVAQSISDYIHTIVCMPRQNSLKFVDICNEKSIDYIQLSLSRITKEKTVMIKYLIFFIYEVYALRKSILFHNVDIVHVSGGSWQFKSIISGLLSGKKVVWHINDSYMPLLIRLCYYFLNRFCDYLIFASNCSYNYYGKFTSNKVPFNIINAPVDTNIFRPLAINQLKNNKFTIGTICNISRVKDLVTFINTAIILNRKFDNLEFYIIGPVFKNQINYYNILNSHLTKNLVKNVNFIHRCYDVRDYLRIFDVYLCTSKSESSPVSVWEAMSMEKPIVSTNVGDLSIILNKHKCGFASDVGNSSELANNLSILYNSPNLLREFGLNARNFVKNNYDIKLISALYIKTYESII